MKSRLPHIIRRAVGADRRLDALEEHQRAMSNQRPFLFAIGFVCILALTISPETFTNTFFLIGLGLVVLSALPGALLSWKKHSSVLYWTIPLLEFGAIAALRTGSEGYLVGLSLVAFFPVIWLAWFMPNSWRVHLVNFTATLIIVSLPLFATETPLSLQALATPLVVPVILTVIGVFAANVSRSIDAQQLELLNKDAELRTVAEASRHHAQLLDTIIETVPVGVVVVDAEGNDLMMNSQQRAMHQMGIPDDVPDPREDQLLVFGEDKVTPLAADQRPVRQAINGASFTNQLIWLGDYRRRRALSVSANQIQDHVGNPAGSVTVFSDVTELVEALEVKDEFLQGVSHELRTPLTSILGYIDLVLEEAERFPETEHLCAKLRVAERNADRLLHLVSDLLTTASQPLLKLQTADLADVVRSSVASAFPQAEAAGITIISEPTLPLPGRFDPNCMHQVIDNLLSNAIKYTPSGGSVTAHAWNDSGCLHLKVSDTGRGISSGNQRQIFEKFFRTSDVRDSAIPGVGLGLAIVKQIIDAHHGSIMVDSTPSRGTTFTVSIPASEPRSDSDGQPQSA